MNGLNYAFNNIPRPSTLMEQTLNWTAEDHAIQDTISQYWYNFIATGDPNGQNLTAWASSSNQSATIIILGDDYGSIPVASDNVIDFLTEYFAQENAY